MDTAKRDALILRMGVLDHYNGGFAPTVIRLVSIETYFDGAEGEAPLLCNSPVEPSNDEIAHQLKQISNRDDVHTVYIAISNCDGDEWPFSDKIVIVTRAPKDEITTWLPEGFEPSEMFEREEFGHAAESAEVPAGYREIWLWYD
jgi:hypothetical protein